MSSSEKESKFLLFDDGFINLSYIREVGLSPIGNKIIFVFAGGDKHIVEYGSKTKEVMSSIIEQLKSNQFPIIAGLKKEEK